MAPRSPEHLVRKPAGEQHPAVELIVPAGATDAEAVERELTTLLLSGGRKRPRRR